MRKLVVNAALLASLGCAEAPPLPTLAAAPAASEASPVAVLPPVHVQVLAINDFHGNLDPPEGHDGSVVVRDEAGSKRVPAGGVAYLATHLRQLRQANPNTVVVSAGDLTGASPLVSNLFRDEPTVAAMSLAGLDIEGVGNHDFDRGIAELARLSQGARFVYLAANVKTSEGVPVLRPYEIREFDGLRVAFLGVTLEGTPTVTAPEAITGLTFANEAATANALLPELRQRGVVTTVILLHQGGFQAEGGTVNSCDGLTGEILPVLAALDPAFRVVVTGHTHQAYNCTVDGRIVTSAASYGRLITQIELTLDPNKRQLTDARAKNVVVTRDVEPEPDVAALVASYKAKAAPVTERVVGHVAAGFTRDPKAAHSSSCETPLGDLIADAELAATRDAGAVIAFMNPGGVRTDLTADATTGAVRYAAAFEVQPFGNVLLTLTLTGIELREVLERQFGRDRPRVMSVSRGFSYRYAYDVKTHTATVDPSSIRLAGAVVRPAQRYRVTVSSFLASGGDGMSVFQHASDRTAGAVDIEAFTAYLSKQSSDRARLAPAPLDRVTGNACE